VRSGADDHEGAVVSLEQVLPSGEENSMAVQQLPADHREKDKGIISGGTLQPAPNARALGAIGPLSAMGEATSSAVANLRSDESCLFHKHTAGLWQQGSIRKRSEKQKGYRSHRYPFVEQMCPEPALGITHTHPSRI